MRMPTISSCAPVLSQPPPNQSGVDKLPTAAAFLAHPAYDDFWRSRGVEWHLDQVSRAHAFVGGFWDQEDMFGPQEAYAKLEPHDSHHENFLVIGPWNHGQWALTYAPSRRHSIRRTDHRRVSRALRGAVFRLLPQG